MITTLTTTTSSFFVFPLSLSLSFLYSHAVPPLGLVILYYCSIHHHDLISLPIPLFSSRLLCDSLDMDSGLIMVSTAITGHGHLARINQKSVFILYIHLIQCHRPYTIHIYTYIQYTYTYPALAIHAYPPESIYAAHTLDLNLGLTWVSLCTAGLINDQAEAVIHALLIDHDRTSVYLSGLPMK